MSERSKLRRKEREEKQEKQANRVVNWIFGVLIALAIIFAISTILMN
jgi:cell division septal protein FtsQ